MDMMTEFARAGRVGRKIKQLIALKCPNHARYCVGQYAGRYFRKTPEGIVFVVTASPQEEKIITVFDISC